MGALVLSRVAAHGPAPAPPRSTVLLLGAAGVVATGLLIVLAEVGEGVPQPGLSAALACWVTTPYIVAGLVAWRRRPESRLGVLMVTAGFATFANFLVWSNNDLLFTVGLAAQALPPVLFLHVFLAFPSGRLGSRPESALVAVAYMAAALTLPALALGLDAPRNVLAVADRPGAAELLLNVQLLVVSALLVAGVGLLWRRRRRGRPTRRSIGFLVDSFSLGLLMIALLLLAGLFDWTRIQEPVRLTTFLVVGLAPMVFLAGLLEARLGRASVAGLLKELGVNPGPAELQEAIARALRDPSVRLAYWLPDYESYADIDGLQIELERDDGRSRTPVTRDGVLVAMLLHDAALDDEQELLAAVGAATGMTIHNAQLQVELRARLEELRGSRVRILEAEQRERRRLERDLHDGAQQRLVALSLELSTIGEEVREHPELCARVEVAQVELAASLAELRDLAHGIHPAAVSDHGLEVALESLATRATVPVQVMGACPDRLPEPVELAAFFMVSEGLTNIAKHARADAAVVELELRGPTLIVEVRDDGVGGAVDGAGLRGLADRLEALGGRLHVWSPIGGGTLLRGEIPCGL